MICEQHFDLEKLSGQALLDDLRRESVIPFSTVFIMLTGSATLGEVTEAAESALDGFLIKPHKASSLLDRLLSARMRKLVMQPIFQAIEAGDFLRASEMCVARYESRQSYWLYSARIAAELMLRLKRVDEAFSLYGAILEAKTTPWAKLGIARSQLEMGHSSAAITTLEDLVQGNSSYADAFDVMAHALIDVGRMEQALESYEMALRSTPGSVVRAQKKAMLQFYLGREDEAREDLLKAAHRAGKSRLFDLQSIMVLAITSLRAKKFGDLQWCLKLVDNMEGAQGLSPRFERIQKMVLALVSFTERREAEGWKLLRSIMAQCTQPDFDFEAACNLLTILATLHELKFSHPEAEDLIVGLGMRFCGTNGATEMLTRATAVHEPYGHMLKDAHSRVLKLAQEAMKLSIAGNPTGAVTAMLDDGERLKNFKLIESAHLMMERHRDRIVNAEVLSQRISEVRASAALRGSKPGPSVQGGSGAALLRLKGEASAKFSAPSQQEETVANAT
ncbi:response regulator [Hydrogenophaga sp. 2FB]|uniref:response regulator n=1 Tax=Hydrogenophaga sp. 2FB TaxID=2502187 RepID=UPI001485755D|nr:response regulator [Hydrogenophaga sp. 2FB]